MNGKQLKEQGQIRVEVNNQEFVDAMRFNARLIAKQNGSVSTDDLRAVADRLNLKPKHPNCWGSIFRGKEFQPLGFIQSKIPSNHARVIREWEVV